MPTRDALKDRSREPAAAARRAEQPLQPSPDTLVGILDRAFLRNGSHPAFLLKQGKGRRQLLYRTLRQRVRAIAAGLIELGLERGQRCGLISESRPEWLLYDLAVLWAGGVDVPRGCDAPGPELEFILQHAQVTQLALEHPKALKELEALGLTDGMEAVVVLDPEGQELPEGVHSLEDVEQLGRAALEAGGQRLAHRLSEIEPDDPVTIIYTSGTTGQPKGVVLSQDNLAYQTEVLTHALEPGDRFLSILPPWHIFERTVEYTALAHGISMAWSKPLPKSLAANLKRFRPTLLVVVPRVLEALHDAFWRKVEKQGIAKEMLTMALIEASKSAWRSGVTLAGSEPDFHEPGLFGRLRRWGRAFVQRHALEPPRRLAERLVFQKIKEGFGGALRQVISGGGKLPSHLDEFFGALGIPVLEGYGMTETSPVISVRQPDSPVPYTVGPPLEGTEVQVVEPGSGRALPPGQTGEVCVRGRLVMQGYHRDPEATSKRIDDEGWLHTGDLGRLTLSGEIQLQGRLKDTIVLRSGKNVEPEPIELALKQSPYIDQVMVVGQDMKHLGVLVVPDLEAVSKALGRSLTIEEAGCLPPVRKLLENELKRHVDLSKGFRPHEQVRRLFVPPRPFEPGRELTHTMKLKRRQVMATYAAEIEAMCDDQ